MIHPPSFAAVLALTVPLAMTSTASARDVPSRPKAFSALVECRKLGDQERLTCYDRQLALLEEAESKQELVVIDRAEIQRTKRSLFGISLPSLKFLDDDSKDAPKFQQIETTITSVLGSSGRWLFVLEDGSKWMQTDAADLAATPKNGQRIRIRKAAMGSYFANVAGQTALRVRRVL